MLDDVCIKPLSGEKAKHVVIILHGIGDSADGIIGLAEPFRLAMPDTEFRAPNAPYPYDFSPFGFQWFSGQDWTPSVVLEGVKKAAEPLNAYIDHVLETHDLTPDKMALVGFSQGTMMSLYVAPRRAPSLAGVVGYSGALVGSETLVKERKSSPPVLLVHGTQDEVLPFAAMTQALGGLRDANMNVTAFTCHGLGHSIDEQGVSQGLLFLRRVFGL